MKTALITGITGQDGSFLSELLLEKGYDVHGTIRRSSVDYRERIAHLEGHPNFHLHYADLGDSMSLIQVISKVRPDEIYNLAAQSHVQVSFDSPEFTADVDATGVLRVLEAVRACNLEKTCRIYQASTSELYGKVEEVPQNENTPFHPYSPYAVAEHAIAMLLTSIRRIHKAYLRTRDFKVIDSEKKFINDLKKYKNYIFYATKSELKTLFTALKDTNIKIPVLIASYYGLRRSEVLGLKEHWEADLTNEEVLHVATLARLELNDDEIEKYLNGQLAKISLENPDYDFLRCKMLEMYANPLINKLSTLNNE